MSSLSSAPGLPAPPPSVSASVLPPHCWTLTETPPGPGEVAPYMNILARKNFRLVNPEDGDQVLYCTCDLKRVSNRGVSAGLSGAGCRRWERRYGASQQANGALLRAWLPRDGFSNEDGTVENLCATIARVFREANVRKAVPLDPEGSQTRKAAKQ